MTNEPELKEKNCHAPDEKLRRYMSEKAYLLRKEEELNLRMETKKKLSKKEEAELQSIKSRTGTLKNTKREILDDIIFPAMANLTFFFDAISQYPELEPDFKVNIWDLLGVRRLNPKPHLLGGNYGFMFGSLVAGILDLASHDKDYKIRLVHMLQELIRLKLYGPEILGTLRTTEIVYDDINQVEAWTEMLALRIPDIYDFTIKKNLTRGSTEEERLEAFEKHVSERLPRRTFTYDTKKLMEWKR